MKRKKFKDRFYTICRDKMEKWMKETFNGEEHLDSVTITWNEDTCMFDGVIVYEPILYGG